MSTPIPVSLERFSEELDRAAHRELSSPQGVWHARVRRPRVLAGATLGLAAGGAALAVALGTSATSPAFAVTRQHNGTVSVHIYRESGIAGANRKLASMGVLERVRTIALTRPLPANCRSSSTQTATAPVTHGTSATTKVAASGPAHETLPIPGKSVVAVCKIPTVLELIAGRVTDNIRSLEGALIRVIARAHGTRAR